MNTARQALSGAAAAAGPDALNATAAQPPQPQPQPQPQPAPAPQPQMESPALVTPTGSQGRAGSQSYASAQRLQARATASGGLAAAPLAAQQPDALQDDANSSGRVSSRQAMPPGQVQPGVAAAHEARLPAIPEAGDAQRPLQHSPSAKGHGQGHGSTASLVVVGRRAAAVCAAAAGQLAARARTLGAASRMWVGAWALQLLLLVALCGSSYRGATHLEHALDVQGNAMAALQLRVSAGEADWRGALQANQDHTAAVSDMQEQVRHAAHGVAAAAAALPTCRGCVPMWDGCARLAVQPRDRKTDGTSDGRQQPS